jgi:hypothetical protein
VTAVQGPVREVCICIIPIFTYVETGLDRDSSTGTSARGTPMYIRKCIYIEKGGLDSDSSTVMSARGNVCIYVYICGCMYIEICA